MPALDVAASQDGASTVVWWNAVRPLVARLLWAWIDANPHFVVFQRRILFLKVTVTVKDLEWWVAHLFGPRPEQPAIPVSVMLGATP